MAAPIKLIVSPGRVPIYCPIILSPKEVIGVGYTGFVAHFGEKEDLVVKVADATHMDDLLAEKRVYEARGPGLLNFLRYYGDKDNTLFLEYAPNGTVRDYIQSGKEMTEKLRTRWIRQLGVKRPPARRISSPSWERIVQ
ncbi:MAG: hypothetical protein MMC23_004283 [Stictis urceolatum]|nr:hypothetical protein [Stictis urceolata]